MRCCRKPHWQQRGGCIKKKNSPIIRDELGQDILINTQLLNRHMSLGNVYMPSSGDHPKFYEEVLSEIDILIKN